MPIKTRYLNGFKIQASDYIQSGLYSKEKQIYCPSKKKKDKENQKKKEERNLKLYSTTSVQSLSRVPIFVRP